MSLLRIEKLTVRFGGLTAVKDVDLTVELGTIVSVIGPNGAGKTTVFNAITGIYHPTQGHVLFDGKRLRRPFGVGVFLNCLLIGALLGSIGFLFALNVNKLFKAAIKRTYADYGNDFNYDRAWQATRAYYRGDLVIEREKENNPRRKPGWIILSPELDEAQARLAYVPMPSPRKFTEADVEKRLKLAEQRRDDIRTGNLNIFPPVEEGEDWTIRAPYRAHVVTKLDGQIEAGVLTVEDADSITLKDENAVVKVIARKDSASIREEIRNRIVESYDSEERCQREIDKIHSLRAAVAARQEDSFIMAIAGFAIGSIGTLLVWLRSRRTTDHIALGGIARTFQNIRLFQNMTVVENVLIGMDRHYCGGAFEMAARLRSVRLEEQQRTEAALQMLAFMGLAERAHMLAKNLPYGDQRRLEIARALASNPKLLLLDEPAAGMNPTETVELMALIRRIRDRGITVLLIEHHMSLVMEISDRIAVLDYGVKIAEGPPDVVKNDPKVIEAYLGKEEVT